ncbi:hypothetical protein RO3G_00151 [Rhizopus delemar RA 99-880]|uniref:Uncharacterized protein n=1 Tax=Rhizopus delemar (strain RA 99-880 / ATCC MYA-4621 / FGSC 9543 / NRRL 43880) TaxID=246409 RepID=I1BGU8_RHIO9|nr:hypothetical protein RO3G_00132 [Rhizopus delemar RA 99-880]EIE75447.1 hypothetical protein RO3G_00151 [Rhizopus delemar RA 99-880]|eukprot:EIE75428.1 hypothetical protein RO3G_00132 [Rhizopus delemar RA 99-880]
MLVTVSVTTLLMNLFKLFTTLLIGNLLKLTILFDHDGSTFMLLTKSLFNRVGEFRRMSRGRRTLVSLSFLLLTVAADILLPWTSTIYFKFARISSEPKAVRPTFLHPSHFSLPTSPNFNYNSTTQYGQAAAQYLLPDLTNDSSKWVDSTTTRIYGPLSGQQFDEKKIKKQLGYQLPKHLYCHHTIMWSCNITQTVEVSQLVTYSGNDSYTVSDFGHYFTGYLNNLQYYVNMVLVDLQQGFFWDGTDMAAYNYSRITLSVWDVEALNLVKSYEILPDVVFMNLKGQIIQSKFSQHDDVAYLATCINDKLYYGTVTCVIETLMTYHVPVASNEIDMIQIDEYDASFATHSLHQLANDFTRSSNRTTKYVITDQARKYKIPDDSYTVVRELEAALSNRSRFLELKGATAYLFQNDTFLLVNNQQYRVGYSITGWIVATAMTTLLVIALYLFSYYNRTIHLISRSPQAIMASATIPSLQTRSGGIPSVTLALSMTHDRTQISLVDISKSPLEEDDKEYILNETILANSKDFSQPVSDDNLHYESAYIVNSRRQANYSGSYMMKNSMTLTPSDSATRYNL